MAYDLGGYVDVATRLRMALKDWPQLRIQETACTLETIGEQSFLVCVITIWRDERDTVPVIASAAEIVPGRTPYTKNSERMVGFTSALGRGLGYMGYGIDKAIASADEVQHKRVVEEPFATTPQSDAVLADHRKMTNAQRNEKRVASNQNATAAQIKMLAVQARKAGLDDAAVFSTVSDVLGKKVLVLEELTKFEASKVIERMLQLAADKQMDNNEQF